MSNDESLESRLQAIEDRLEIYNLIAAHPPSADTGSGFYSEYIYTVDGIFDRNENVPITQGSHAI